MRDVETAKGKVETVDEARLCGVCGERKTHRVVNGVYTCLPCFEAMPEAPAEVTQTPKPKAPDEGEGYGDYLCPKCKVTHRAGSKIHKRHLKLLK